LGVQLLSQNIGRLTNIRLINIKNGQNTSKLCTIIRLDWALFHLVQSCPNFGQQPFGVCLRLPGAARVQAGIEDGQIEVSGEMEG